YDLSNFINSPGLMYEELKYLTDLNIFARSNRSIALHIYILFLSMAGVPPLSCFFSILYILISALYLYYFDLFIICLFFIFIFLYAISWFLVVFILYETLQSDEIRSFDFITMLFDGFNNGFLFQ